jgi:hypothetical protein
MPILRSGYAGGQRISLHAWIVYGAIGILFDLSHSAAFSDLPESRGTDRDTDTIVTKKRKAFKTPPPPMQIPRAVQIPRAAVEALRQFKEDSAKKDRQCCELRIRIANMQTSVSAAAHDNAVYVEALRDLIGFYDKIRGKAGDGVGWTVAQVKRLEEIRLLSLGV